MKKLRILLRVVGILQIALGVAYLLAPGALTQWMKLLPAPHDANYAYGMLASRFIAYGIGMFVIAKAPEGNSFWIKNMILVQLIDLGVGVFYTAQGVLALSSSAFPMFNAALIASLLFIWRPKKDGSEINGSL